MSKAADMAKVPVKGGFHLLWGLVASTVISAVGTVILAWLLGDTEYGILGRLFNRLLNLIEKIMTTLRL